MMNYRKIYENHYGSIPNDIDGRTYEIHHIDGNRDNNDPNNLIALTIQDHYDIHFKQQDFNACRLIALRQNKSPEEISLLASLGTASANQQGRCGFGLGHASAAGTIGGKSSGNLAKKNKTGIFSLSFQKNVEREYRSACTKAISCGRASSYPRLSDPVLYKFQHILTNDVICCSAFELSFRLDIHPERIKRLLNGKIKSVLGWRRLSDS